MERKILDSIHQYLFRWNLVHYAVAREAGVAPSTLSRALNHKRSISLQAACRIIEVMQERAKKTVIVYELYTILGEGDKEFKLLEVQQEMGYFDNGCGWDNLSKASLVAAAWDWPK